MKVLLIRFGGIGDAFPVMVAASVLKKQGHDVTVVLRDDGAATKQTELFRNQTDYTFIDMEEIGPWRSRTIPFKGGLIEVRAIFKNYDLVIDFMGVVENNSTSPVNNLKDPWEFWQRSRNSNYVNWYDLHLAWCNINPATIDDEDKRPLLSLTKTEQGISDGLKDDGKLFVVSPFASSLSRSWYQAEKLIDPILKTYDKARIAFWNPSRGGWDMFSKKGRGQLPKLTFNPLRDTMTLISASDLVISVDTGAGHMAEALDKKSLVIYSTIPAWTRNKYYKYQTAIDPVKDNPEFATFSLGLGDPLRVKEGMSNLTEREVQLKGFIDRRAQVGEIMEALNTDKRGVEIEAQMLASKVEAWERQQSKALSSIKPEFVFERIKEIVHD